MIIRSNNENTIYFVSVIVDLINLNDNDPVILTLPAVLGKPEMPFSELKNHSILHYLWSTDLLRILS